MCSMQMEKGFPKPPNRCSSWATLALWQGRRWGRFIGFWLLLLLNLPPVLSQDLREVESLFQRAQQRFLKGDFDGVITDSTKVIELTTRLQPPSRSEKLARNWREAEGQAIGVIDLRAAWAYTMRGVARHQQRNYEDALADFNHALRLAPRYAGAYVARAMTWQAKGELVQALLDYNRALQPDAYYADAYNNRGCLFADQGKFREALADFDVAISLSPREALIYGNRGRARLNLQDFVGAIADLTRAIELDAKVAWFYLGRGIALFDEYQLERAQKDFDRAIALDAQCAEAYANRGLVQWLRGNEMAAEADFARCLALKPELRPLLEQKIAKTKARRVERQQDK